MRMEFYSNVKRDKKSFKVDRLTYGKRNALFIDLYFFEIVAKWGF